MPAKKSTPDNPPPAASNCTAEVEVDVSVELDRTRVSIETLLGWREGSLIELARVSGDPVEVRVNNELFATGEVITIAENFGVRLLQLLNE